VRLGAVCAAMFGLYSTAARRWMTGWGASLAERDMHLPGDAIVRRPRYSQTHAVTIAAKPRDVWPWLVQIGQGRGGLYSYDRLENAFGCDIHSADRIVPELQHLHVGDRVRLVPEDFSVPLWLTVESVHPPTSLVLKGEGEPAESRADGMVMPSWSFVALPAVSGTRLIARWRHDFDPSVKGYLTWKFSLEPIHFVMERAMLRGIKRRAEAEPSPRERLERTLS
jgi:hypothetical protein